METDRAAERVADLRIPGPGDTLVIWITADLGEKSSKLAEDLAADFAAMPADRRNVSASTGWRQAYHAWRAEQNADRKAPAEYLGRLRRPLEQVAMVADDLGMLVGDPGLDRLYLRAPPDADTWRRFCARVGLQRPGGGDGGVRLGICDGCAGLKPLYADGTVARHDLAVPAAQRARGDGRRRRRCPGSGRPPRRKEP